MHGKTCCRILEAGSAVLVTLVRQWKKRYQSWFDSGTRATNNDDLELHKCGGTFRCFRAYAGVVAFLRLVPPDEASLTPMVRTVCSRTEVRETLTTTSVAEARFSMWGFGLHSTNSNVSLCTSIFFMLKLRSTEVISTS